MRYIELTQGYKTLVDDEDYELVASYKWYVRKSTHTNYAQRKADLRSSKTSVHRLLMNAKKGEFIDHINMNGLDNRRCNLRKCSKAQNSMNIKKYKNKASRYKGVTYCKATLKWRAIIGFKGKSKCLGRYVNEIDAARAYNLKAAELFGEFARINDLTANDSLTNDPCDN